MKRKIPCVCGNEIALLDDSGFCDRCGFEYYSTEKYLQQMAGWDPNKAKKSEDSDD